MTKDEINQTIQELNKSPFFRLSLASHELVHSNFLAWIWNTYPKESIPLIRNFFELNEINGEELTIEREHNNIDLLLQIDQVPILIIENKTKSFPHLDQIRKINVIPNQQNARKCLLTLHTFQPPDQWRVDLQGWILRDYATLIEKVLKPLLEILSGYHKDLLDDYIGSVGKLIELINHTQVNAENEENEVITPPWITKVEDNRLRALISKFRFRYLADFVVKMLNSKFAPIYIDHHKHITAQQQGNWFYEVGFTKSKPLISFSKCIEIGRDGKPVMLGIQMQDTQYRQFIHCNAGADTHAIKYEDWLQNPHGFDELNNPIRNAPYNRFGDEFIYRYAPLNQDELTVENFIIALNTSVEYVNNLTMTLYFAYGSNLLCSQMTERCPEHTILSLASLPDHRFLIGERGYATIKPEAGQTDGLNDVHLSFIVWLCHNKTRSRPNSLWSHLPNLQL